MAMRILRRRDGLLQIRPRRTRDLVLGHDTGVLIALMAGCVLFAGMLSAMLVMAPLALAIASTFIVLGAFSVALALAHPPAAPRVDPPPRRVA